MAPFGLKGNELQENKMGKKIDCCSLVWRKDEIENENKIPKEKKPPQLSFTVSSLQPSKHRGKKCRNGFEEDADHLL